MANRKRCVFYQSTDLKLADNLFKPFSIDSKCFIYILVKRIHYKYLRSCREALLACKSSHHLVSKIDSSVYKYFLAPLLTFAKKFKISLHKSWTDAWILLLLCVSQISPQEEIANLIEEGETRSMQRTGGRSFEVADMIIWDFWHKIHGYKQQVDCTLDIFSCFPVFPSLYSFFCDLDSIRMKESRITLLCDTAIVSLRKIICTHT